MSVYDLPDQSNNPAQLHAALYAAREFVNSTDEVGEDVVDILKTYLHDIWQIYNTQVCMQLIQDVLLEVRGTVIVSYVEGYEF